MGNQGFLELGLLDVANQPAHDSATRVRVFRSSDNREIILTQPPKEVQSK